MASEYETFLALTLPEPTVILGQELKALTIGHLLWLDRLEILPAVDPERVALGIVICTQEPAEILETIEDPWIGFKIKFWLFRCAPFREINWMKKGMEFSEYIKEGTRTPSVVSLRDEGKGNSLADSGTPFLQHVKATLQSKLNYSPEGAFACPFAQAMWDFYSYHENEGNLMVCDRDHRKELADRANEMHDEWIADALAMRNGEGSVKSGV